MVNMVGRRHINYNGYKEWLSRGLSVIYIANGLTYTICIYRKRAGKVVRLNLYHANKIQLIQHQML